jgi:hypothetical protein
MLIDTKIWLNTGLIDACHSSSVYFSDPKTESFNNTKLIRFYIHE